jgi:hypothetical protein
VRTLAAILALSLCAGSASAQTGAAPVHAPGPAVQAESVAAPGDYRPALDPSRWNLGREAVPQGRSVAADAPAHRRWWQWTLLALSEASWGAGSVYDLHQSQAGFAEGVLTEGGPLVRRRDGGVNAPVGWALTIAVGGGAAAASHWQPTAAPLALAGCSGLRWWMGKRASNARKEKERRTR